MDPQIFITYSSKDQKVARTICSALEHRGLACWISSRNVRPGQNYQEQIVKAIRAARIMVLVFTANANNSNEIKKELALASQNNLVVIPVRIEDVAPNEAFTYEFATRQWIDLFDDWENSIAQLVELIAAIIADHPPGERAKAGPEFTGTAAPPSFVMAPLATAPASFIQGPGFRWAMIGGVAVIVAAAVAYKVATLSSAPPPVPVAQPPKTQVAIPSPAPSPPAPPPVAAVTYGALAVGLPADVAKSGFTYGYSNGNVDAKHAEAAALDSCRSTKDAAKDSNLRSLCKVVQDYSNQCVAVAMDPAAGTPGVGWAVTNDLRSAERQALAKCEDTAGPSRRAACVVDHSGCDGNPR